MDKYVCIHGHFYQPPRENPWLEAVEYQDSAYPYHDWNDRITAECYGPNTASRILDSNGRIIGIMNNFERISFNMGPTLLSWMQAAQPDIYAAIIDADIKSREHFNGHGTAIAQVYNHIIMPLANSRDKETQVVWGIADFKHRFGRNPEGIWLAETAVDLETLEILVHHGITFTILAPRQAHKVRLTPNSEWQDVSDGKIDIRLPYLCRLPSGATITLFFYDGPIAQDLAFAGLLHNGEQFAQRLVDAFAHDYEGPQLVHIATDGETYGHHHKRGEMALSYCLHKLEASELANITNYAEYLEKHPATAEVIIHENSSWSCIHGVERWRDDCGCSSGMHHGWNQKWRKPLRESLDWLRDTIEPHFVAKASEYLKDPWRAREEYIHVLLNKTDEEVDKFIGRHAVRKLEEEEKIAVLRLLEMQRNAMLMYTSCGWFFDEISGIETTQVLRYASRAIQLVVETGGQNLDDEFAARLREAPSNIPENENGEVVYRKYVQPSSMGLLRVGAHFAVSALFMDFQKEDRIYCFETSSELCERIEAGKFRLAIGRVHVRSTITHARTNISFAAIHLGDQNVAAGVREFLDEEAFQQMRADIRQPFEKGDIPETLRALDKHFENHNFSLWHLFKDQQRRVLEALFDETEKKVESACRQMYQDHYYLMQAMQSLEQPQLEILSAATKFLLNRDLRRILSQWPIDEDAYKQAVEQVRKWSVELDREMLGLMGSNKINELVAELQENPLDSTILEALENVLAKYQELEVPLNLWRSQNIVYEIGLQQFFLRSRLAEKQQEDAVQWVAHFKNVSNLLGVQLE